MLSNSLKILGIETSCDETAAAVVQRTDSGSGIILSNIVRSQIAQHAPYGGVVPEIAARAHVDILDDIVKLAIESADITFKELDGIAVSAGPGLVGGLIVGMVTAKSIAAVHNKPFLGINHLEGHALTVGLTDNLQPPYLLLLVSGGHTQLVVVEDVGKYERLGTTVDDALGEAFDKTAKMLGLGYPGGPKVEALARKGNPGRFHLPRPMFDRLEPNFSFAGLKTAIRQAAQSQAPLDKATISDLCAGFQSAVVDCVVNRTQNAMQLYCGKVGPDAQRKLVLSGGVGANRFIRDHLRNLSEISGFELVVPPVDLCTDNAAMIAWAGAERLKRGWTDRLDLEANTRWQLDVAAPNIKGTGYPKLPSNHSSLV